VDELKGMGGMGIQQLFNLVERVIDVERDGDGVE
jgi:hypothetical protein